MTGPLQQRRNDVLRLYREVDEATRAFAEGSGLTCPPDCGRCCENPRVEATVVEMLPAAIAFFDEGRAGEMHERARAGKGQWCIFFASHGDGKGRCTEYAHRPSLCRLFGYAGIRKKRGELELAVCAVHSVEQAGTVTRAMERVERGELAMPVFADQARALHLLDPVDGRTTMPINDALVLALEKVFRARR